MSPAVDEPGGGTRRLLVALALASALSPLNSTMIAVALPTIGADLPAELTTLTHWLVTSYLLVAIVAQSPAGKLGDLLGHGRMLHAGQLATALGAVGGLLARNLAMLTGARVLMAVGGALMVPSAMALVRSQLPRGARGHAFGAFGAMMALAAALGPTLGGEIVARFGWRAIFLANVPPLALSVLLATGCAKADRRAAGRPTFDLAGTALLGVGLTLVIVGLQLLGVAGAILGALGLVTLAGFRRWERRAREPVIDLTLLSRRAFFAGSAICALQNLALYGLLFQLPFLFALAFDADSADTGRLMLALMAMLVVFSPLSGLCTRRVGARATVLVGSLVATAGLAWLALGSLESAAEVIPPLLVLGTGLGLTNAPSQTAALDAVEAERSGMAAGLMSTMRYLGGVAGIAALGIVLGTGPGATLARHRVTMLVFAAALVASAAASLALPRRERRS